MSHQKWEKKKEKARNEGNLDDLYVACIELASLYMSQENYEDALREFKEAKRAAEAGHNIINVAVSHRMIGEIYMKMLDYDSAIKHQQKYLELSREQKDAVEEQRALANLGHMYFLKADTFPNPTAQERQSCLEKSEKYSRLSLQTCERLTNVNKKELVEMQARLFLNLGLVVEQQNETDTAISHFNKAITLCKSMDIWPYLCRTYNALAGLYYSKGDHTRALEYVDKALNVAQRLPDKEQQICDSLQLKADILFDLPDFKGAKQCLLKAYKLNTENRNEVEKKLKTVAAVSRYEEKLLDTPDCDLATRKSLYESLGDGCAAMMSYSKALEYYYLMLETARNLGESGEQLRPCFVSLHQTYKDNKQYDLAIRFLEEELGLNHDNPVEACKTTLSIAEVLELKEADVDEVAECYRRARSLAQAAADVRLEARTLEALVQLLKEKNRLTDARKMEAELENLREKYGPIDSSSESEEENTPDIGADINISDLSDDEPDPGEAQKARVRKRCSATKFRRNEKGEYPLHTACIAGNLTLVKKLLDQGHPVNVRDHGGWSPLHEACNHGHLEIVETLLDHGAIINDRGSDVSDGVTPLLDAASCGNLAVVRLLLRRGASPVMRTNKGETVLDCLTGWRKRYRKEENSDLDPETLEQYNDIVKTLRAALQKAGHNPDTERRSPTPPLPSYHTDKHPVSRHSGNGYRESTSQRPETSSARRSFEGDDFMGRHGFSDKDKSRTSSSSLRRSTDEGLPRNSTNATKEYEEAIKALRRKHTTMSSPKSPRRTEHSALLPSEEVVDDWLIDDLAPSTSRGVKRRRSHHFEGEPQRRANRVSSPPPAPHQSAPHQSEDERRHSYRPLSPVDLFSQDQMEDVDLVDSVSDDTSSIGTETWQVNITQPHPGPTLSNSRPVAAATRQAPLTGFGIVRSPAPAPLPVDPVLVPSSQLAPPSQSTQMGMPAVKVRVEGKLLLVPLPILENSQETRTIAWLAEEAAKRYYSFEGREPRLSLQTEEGAMLSPHDPLTLLVGCPSVVGVVDGWKVHRVSDRYREVCTEMGVEVDDYLERCLEGSSFSLSLADCGLDSTLVEPVFRALVTQSTLQRLILCDNRLGDEGVQILAKLIPKLPQLRELDLSCNGITGDGLNSLVQQATEHNALQRLESLKLSHNRLGGACVGPLSRLLETTRALTDLSIAAVGLTAASLVGTCRLNLERIEKLEAGLNVLGGDGVRALLRGLCMGRVVTLHLGHTGAGVVGEVGRWLAAGDAARLTTLSLAHCPDNEAAYTQLVRNLPRTLEHLELSCPETLDLETLQPLFRLSLRVLRLPGVRVGPIPLSAPPPPVHQLSCLALSDAPAPFWALTGPFGLLTNNPCTS